MLTSWLWDGGGKGQLPMCAIPASRQPMSPFISTLSVDLSFVSHPFPNLIQSVYERHVDEKYDHHNPCQDRLVVSGESARD